VLEQQETFGKLLDLRSDSPKAANEDGRIGAKHRPDEVRRLANAMLRAKDRGSVFSCLTGAGCSLSAGIPLALDLIKEALAGFREDCERHIGEARFHDYGAVMSCLTYNERRYVLEKYLSAAKVNAANLALAALMKHGFLRQVLTFNFDRLLEQACAIVGFVPAVYDFGAAPVGEFGHFTPGSIIHLHGQDYGPALPASEKEAGDHSDRLRSLTREVLWGSPALIAGYSGRSDSLFPLLRGEFRGLDRLYWIELEERPSEQQTSLTAVAPKTSEFIGGADADDFLVELATALDCWPPKLFVDPYGHLLETIDPIAELQFRDGSETRDLTQDLRAKLRDDQARMAADERRLASAAPIPLPDWSDVSAGRAEAASGPDRDLAAWTNVVSGTDLAELAKQKQDETLYRRAFDKFAEALELRPDDHDALYNWANALADLATLKQDETLYLDSFAKYADALRIRPDDHGALSNWGNALVSLAILKQDETLFREAFELYDDALQIEPGDHTVLYSWGTALAELAKRKKDETLFREAFDKYAEAAKRKPDHHELLANWGHAILALAALKHDEGLYNEAIDKYASALRLAPGNQDALAGWADALAGLAAIKQDETLFRNAFEKYADVLKITPNDEDILFKWGVALSDLGSLKQDEALLGEAAAKFAEALSLRPGVFDAVYRWGSTLLALANLKPAAAHFEDAVAKLAEASSLRPSSHESLNNWGNALLGLAMLRHDAGLYREAISKYADAVRVKPDKHEAIYNWGTALLGLAALTADDSLYREACGKFDEAIKIKPDKHEAYYNWGNALLALAKLHHNKDIFRDACAKYAEAVRLKPGKHEALYNWGGALVALWHLTKNNRLLGEAREILDRHDAINPNQPYNRACLAAIEGDEHGCRYRLELCSQLGVLPGKEHLEQDPDLKSVRNRDWFKRLAAA
jgi:tetratricopeptide (TPR) repeat protein